MGKDNVDFQSTPCHSLTTPLMSFLHTRMLRVARPGGLVAAREAIGSTYQSATSRPSFSQWRALYAAIARRNGAEPDAGLFLSSWIQQAGAEPESIGYWNSVVSYSRMNGNARCAYCEAWVDRAKHSSFAEQAVEYGLADASTLEEISVGWAAMAVDPHAVVLYTDGEVLGRKHSSEVQQRSE